MASPQDSSKAQWDKIVAILKTEMGSGRLKNVQWTDVAGTVHTETMGYVNRSLHLYTGVLPACGVQLSSYQLSPEGAARRKLATEFVILVSVQAPAAYTNGTGNTIPSNADDALAMGYAFVSDGNGNGITNIFKDQNNYTLGGLVMSSRITKVQPFAQIGEGQTPQVWADYYLTLYCETLVNLF